MEAFPWISMAVSLVILVIQALARYGITKQEEMTRKRFEEVEKDIACLVAKQATSETQFTSVLVTLESIKTKQDNQVRVVSTELFEARMTGLDSRISTMEQGIAGLTKAQSEMMGKVLDSMKRSGHYRSVTPTSGRRD